MRSAIDTTKLNSQGAVLEITDKRRMANTNAENRMIDYSIQEVIAIPSHLPILEVVEATRFWKSLISSITCQADLLRHQRCTIVRIIVFFRAHPCIFCSVFI